ncbi:pantoate--beta-alanine ligase [Thiolapillus brandeum]|uniref:Pantothenate synthetase n=1 Tax=Thiolapillus brandeum TaxID=1076588 RepID=A0A7U6GIF2_9GAMM|nr:pantoate--beta-alanine ligase [Thiolapillus brandeum]BAO44190.1 pantoate--beta-alanine ligase [Thiolapillus brandeum]
MRQIPDAASLREARKALPGRVALVPTMGNLHQGHLTLVRRAREVADNVVVSIFVNPLQFDRQEDLDAYPRTLDKDAALLEKEGVDLVFNPPVDDIYPESMQTHTRVEVPGLSDIFCGASRPGHFAGVATIVCKLFNMVQPDCAVFGKKDFQQLLIVRHMVEDLAMPVEIIGVDTVREADGLAMSSRNNYLDEAQRARAPALYAALQHTAAALRAGRRDFTALEAEATDLIAAGGLEPDYLGIRRAADLGMPDPDERSLVILGAAYLGLARLIDNLEVEL